MIVFVTVVHILVSLGLILVVLVQTGKGADMGAVFGGSSSTIFGSSGAGNFLTRLTTGMAVVFMVTSLTLGYFAGKGPSSSVVDTLTQEVPPASRPAAAPEDKKEANPPATNPQPPEPSAP